MSNCPNMFAFFKIGKICILTVTLTVNINVKEKPINSDDEKSLFYLKNINV